MREEAPMTPRGTQRIDITPNTIFRVIVILVALWFLYVIRDILLMLLASVVIASAIEPLARKLRQRYSVPRSLSVVVVYVLVLALVGSAVVLMIPPLTEQVTQLAQQLPQYAAQVQARLGLAETGAGNLIDLREDLQQFREGLAGVGVNIFQQTRDVFAGIVSLVFVLILGFYLIIEEGALKKFFRLLIPKQHLPYVEHVLERMEMGLGRWVLGQLALAVIVGVIVGVGLWIMGVPYALALGLLAGVLEIIPVIGPFIAGLFGVFVAVSQSLWLGVGTLAFYVVVQQVENHVLVPSIMRRATGLNPLVTLLAVLLGGRLAGLAGVILSVPVAIMLSILLSDFFGHKDQETQITH